MTVVPLVTGENAKILRTVCQPVVAFNADLAELITNMTDTMLHPMEDGSPVGVGIAAPQIGVDARVFLVTINAEAPKKSRVVAMINPEIVEISEHQTAMEEGCLSLPNTFGTVRRPSKVKVKWRNTAGAWSERRFDGFDARVIQHEMDHLNGVLFLDHNPTNLHTN